MGNKERKTHLFDQGAAALRALGLNDDYYACPICLVLCDREQLRAGDLTEEHVPPRSQGGRPIILTCRTCNSQAGHNYEYALKDRDRVLRQMSSFEAENADVGRVKLKLGDATVSALLRKSSGDYHFLIPSSTNNPRIVADFRSAIEGGTSAVQLSVQLEHRLDRSKVRLSDLKSAFLVCVANFGYSYAQSEYLTCIRRQLIYGREIEYVARYQNTPSIPRNSIFADLEKGIMLVKFKHHAIMMPTSYLPTEQFLEVARSPGRIDLNGGYQLFPTTFIAQNDHLGLHRISTTTEPQI